MTKRRPTKVDSHIGARIRLCRLELGLSQEQLAEKLGMSYQQVQKYEAGHNRISASRLFELAGHLGKDVSFFYGCMIGEQAQAPDSAVDTTKLMSVPGAIGLLQNYAVMPSETKRAILNIASAATGGITS